MDNVKKKLGNNIKRFRLSRGLKQSELAELVGVEDKTISRIEVGGNYPSMDLLVRLSNVLKYDLTEFVNFKDTIIDSLCELNKNEIKTIKKFIKLIDEKSSHI
ncbi:helix-turn-helix transcriptional regulator [bacterium]|nr:helix-turn-helix transcriptional regulator [bacterium]